MWLPDRTKLLKVRLHNQGEDPETVWAEDLGAAPLPGASRYVRIGNIPMLHAKPTYGDVIEVIPDADGMPEWDRNGVDFDDIGTRILEDSGRWVAVIDYWPSRPRAKVASAFKALDVAAQALDIAVEGAISDKKRGTAFLAVPDSMEVDDLEDWLESQSTSFGFELRHPVDGSA